MSRTSQASQVSQASKETTARAATTVARPTYAIPNLRLLIIIINCSSGLGLAAALSSLSSPAMSGRPDNVNDEAGIAGRGTPARRPTAIMQLRSDSARLGSSSWSRVAQVG